MLCWHGKQGFHMLICCSGRIVAALCLVSPCLKCVEPPVFVERALWPHRHRGSLLFLARAVLEGFLCSCRASPRDVLRTTLLLREVTMPSWLKERENPFQESARGFP